jgi:hypothetical protein
MQGRTLSCPGCKQSFLTPTAPQAISPPAPVVPQDHNPFSFDEKPPSRRRDEDYSDEPPRRSRREDDEDRPRRSRREDDDYDDRPRRSRRDDDDDYRAAPPPQGGGSAKVMGILSIVFCCIPLLSIILASVALSQANTALKNLPRGSRYRTERQSLESTKTLATVGMCLAFVVMVVGAIVRIAAR